MPCPRTNRARYQQVLNWLQERFPVKYKVRLRIEDLGRSEQGHAVRSGRNGFILRIHRTLPRWLALDTLLHEYAHVMTWPEAMPTKGHTIHSDEWALAFARVYRLYVDEEGDVESRQWPWEPV